MRLRSEDCREQRGLEMKRWTALALAGFIMALIVIAVPAQAKPKIIWQPKKISDEVIRGTSRTITVTFEASARLEHLTVRVVPELQAFLTVAPSSFVEVTSGIPVSIDLLINVPSETPTGVYDGTVQVRSGMGQNSPTLARPLPIEITVVASLPDGLPPDPGDEGKQTLEGIDSDQDGIRDDVQRFIALEFPDSEATRSALTQYALAFQEALIDADSKEASLTHATAVMRAIECIFVIRTEEDAEDIAEEFVSVVVNTEERLDAYLTHDRQLGGEIFPGAIPGDEESSCAFDLSSQAG